MKTQISKNSFQPKKGYSGVFQQMGRMITDADWNEQSMINRERLAQALKDVIGSGTPSEDGLVKLDRNTGLATLQWGKVYVDGLMATVEPNAQDANNSFAYDNQRDFPVDAKTTIPNGSKVYVDVWERTVTYLEDETLRDSALHGADTCTRTQTVAQVKHCPEEIDPLDTDINPQKGNAELTLTVRSNNEQSNPCDPCAETLELQEATGNYLFRVEVHDVVYVQNDQIKSITLKWSSENGAEAYPDAKDGNLPTGYLSDKYIYERFSNKSDDEKLASEKHLGKHLSSDFTPIRGQLASHENKLLENDGSANLTAIRRWDGWCKITKTESNQWHISEGKDRGSELSAGTVESSPGPTSSLGESITIKLSALTLKLDVHEKTFLAGDFWQTSVRELEHTQKSILIDKEEPAGILHHYLLLGTWDENNNKLIPDKDHAVNPFEFPSLTDLQVCKGSGCSTFTVFPQPSWESVFDEIEEDKDAHICFREGVYTLQDTVILSKKGHIKITGIGKGTKIICKNRETVFRFDHCDSVQVENIFCFADAAGYTDQPKSTDKRKHLNGALTFISCKDVTVKQVTLRNANATRPLSTCLTIKDTNKKPGKARIKDNLFEVGHQQIGMLLINQARVTVEDNIIETRTKPKWMTVNVMLNDCQVASRVRKILIKNASATEDNSSANLVPLNIECGVKNETQIWFETSFLDNQQLIIDIFKKIITSEQCPESNFELLELVKKEIMALLMDEKYRENFESFVEWIKSLEQQNPVVMAKGIVCAGTISKEVRILNNTITGVQIGVQIGVSDRKEDPTKTYKIGKTRIIGNTIHNLLSPFTGRQRMGIFIGNCSQFSIIDNSITIQRFPATQQLSVEGIRAYGIFGEKMIIKENFLKGFTTGVRINALNIDKDKTHQWLVADNIITGAEEKKAVIEKTSGILKERDNVT